MQNKPRILWLDQLKGLAVILMVVYHFAFNLNFLGHASLDLQDGGWLIMARFVQFTFLISVGIGLYMSHKGRPENFLKRQLSRAGKLFIIALGITVVTLLIVPNQFILFGILHLITVAILVGMLVTPRPLISLGLSILILLLTPFVISYHPSHLWLTPLGAYPYGFASIDYFSIFPWLSLPLAGIFFAHIIDGTRLTKTTQKTTLISKIGRRSLLIYLVHQPVLLGLIKIFT